MKAAIVKASTLVTTNRWDAKYHLAIAEYLSEHELAETSDNVKLAMDAIKARDTVTKEAALKLREDAATLVDQARKLDESAELTFPLRARF